MADDANSRVSASIFLDEIKTNISGISNYTPADSAEKWIFAEVSVGNGASTNLLGTANDYLGSGIGVSLTDTFQWIFIKNLSTTSTEGIGIDFNAGTAAYNLKTTMFIGAGESIIVKVPNATVEDCHARSCTMDSTGSYPTAQGSATVKVHVAGILNDR
jgi:hypothetical protein|tara:strand:+ start:608 stop:1084 length:477 start_codon:yes stop_codon:yes gene_type:complete